MADVDFSSAAAPSMGLLQGLQQGINAGMLINQERDRRNLQAMQMKQVQEQQARKKMAEGLAYLEKNYVPKPFKLLVYNQMVRPYFQGSSVPVPELTDWPDFGDQAAKELSAIITKGQKDGLHPQDIETMAAMSLMKYEPEFAKRGQPVLESLRAQGEQQARQANINAARAQAAVKPPSGFRFTADGNLEPIPGGPADQKLAAGQAGKEQALNLYETAREGLMSGLEGSFTGPVAGKIPAITSAQQVAEGGVAAMAPVLKQLFRVAGEGTFTDKDQELLLNMVPTRKDNKDAARMKIANIDRIVKAKLGIGQQEAGVSPTARNAAAPAAPAAGETQTRRKNPQTGEWWVYGGGRWQKE